MKIAFCTPLHVQSAIARVSVNVANELTKRGHSVTLVNIERTLNAPVHETEQRQIFWTDPAALIFLRDADAIAIQIGDNYEYHAGAIHILHTFRCTGIFHDANIYNLFRMWAFDGRSDSEGMKFFESKFRKVYFGVPDLQINGPDEHLRFDMIRWLAAQCSSALVHATFYAARVEEFCPGQVVTTPLTYDFKSLPQKPAQGSAPRSRILTFGHINPNKCCDMVIEAMGKSTIRDTSEYRIVGPVTEEERKRLTAIASQHQVKIAITGRVSDAEISSELQLADIVCCLRKPILEGASASTIESMLCARPTIVPDAGSYAEIDNSAVLKVSSDFAIDEIKTALERFAEDHEFRHAVGQRGRDWAVTNCSVENYVNSLEKALATAVAAQPLLELSNTYVDQLRQLGIDQDHTVFFEVADCLQSLFEVEAGAA